MRICCPSGKKKLNDTCTSWDECCSSVCYDSKCCQLPGCPCETNDDCCHKDCDETTKVCFVYVLNHYGWHALELNLKWKTIIKRRVLKTVGTTNLCKQDFKETFYYYALLDIHDIYIMKLCFKYTSGFQEGWEVKDYVTVFDETYFAVLFQK